jgi:hypothetical protein
MEVLQQIVTYIIIAAAVIYTVYSFIKETLYSDKKSGGCCNCDRCDTKRIS